MKRIIKALALGAMVIAAVAGCNPTENSTTSESTIPSSDITSSRSSENPITSDSSSSSITSSSTSTSTSIAPTLTGITLNTTNVKKEYLHGDTLDLVGLVVIAKYSDNTNATVNNYTTNPANGSTLDSIGPVKITVSYESFTADFDVIVSAKVTGIEIDTNSVKKQYEQGEALDLTGLVVTAKYSNNTSKNVNDYTTNPEKGTVFNEIKEETITVSYASFEKTFKVNVVTPSKKAWTADEAKIMSDNLHGVVLPYTGSEESVVIFDEEATSVIIRGGEATSSSLMAYGLLLTADGFKRVNNNAYVYEKSIQIEQGIRFVRVGFISMEGVFYLQAYDPYFYEFPVADAKELAGAFDSGVIIPSVNATYFEVDYGELGIFCYSENASIAAEYTALLETANWDIKEELNKGYKVAISPDGKYLINYKYNEELLSLDIYFGPLNYWNKKVVEDFFKKYNGYVVDIPAFTVEGAEYVFAESYLNAEAYAQGVYEAIHAFMYLYGAQPSNLATYANVLTEAGWDVETSGGHYYAYLTIANKGVARIEFNYESKINAISVTIYFLLDPIPEVEWPASKIAEYLGKYTIDSIPAFTAANKGFVMLDDMFGTAVMVKVERGTEAAAVEAYRETLLTANYRVTGDESFASPSNEIAVSVYSAEGGSITIAFRKTGYLNVFPVQFLREFYNTKDTIPSEQYASSYVFKITGERSVQITCTFSSDEARNDAKAKYTVLLGQAGYTGNEESGFVSPSEDLLIRYTSEDNKLCIAFEGEPKNDFNSLWPTNKIASLFANKGYTDPLPSYDKVCDIITADDYYDGNIYITIETGDASSVASEYINSLVKAKFTYNYGQSIVSNTDVYDSPNKQYYVEVSTNRFGVQLKVVSLGGGNQGENEFPMDKIVEDFPTADGVLPTINAEGATFKYEDPYTGEATLTVTFSSGEAATAAYNAYIEALTTALFTHETVWGMDVYVSPDRKFMIEFDVDDLNQGSFEMCFMDTGGMI